MATTGTQQLDQCPPAQLLDRTTGQNIRVLPAHASQSSSLKMIHALWSKRARPPRAARGRVWGRPFWSPASWCDGSLCRAWPKRGGSRALSPPILYRVGKHRSLLCFAMFLSSAIALRRRSESTKAERLEVQRRARKDQPGKRLENDTRRGIAARRLFDGAEHLSTNPHVQASWWDSRARSSEGRRCARLRKDEYVDRIVPLGVGSSSTGTYGFLACNDGERNHQGRWVGQSSARDTSRQSCTPASAIKPAAQLVALHGRLA